MESALVCAYQFDGQGGFQDLDAPEATAAGDGFCWLHWRLEAPETRDWLGQHSGLDPLVQDALLAPETRPRCTTFRDGILINLRGVNLNPGSDPEDMVSIRLWIEEHRVISVRKRKLMAVDDLRATFTGGSAPHGPGGLLCRLANKLTLRAAPVITDIDGEVDDLDESMVAGGDISDRLSELRRQIVILRRYVAPQRDALRALAEIDMAWISQQNRNQIREVADQVTRLVEELDQARERASVINDELGVRLAARMGRTSYLLSVVAGIFLPLGFITGLLGINVGGIPGATTPWAFAAVTVGLVVLGGAGALLLRRLGWI